MTIAAAILVILRAPSVATILEFQLQAAVKFDPNIALFRFTRRAVQSQPLEIAISF